METGGTLGTRVIDMTETELLAEMERQLGEAAEKLQPTAKERAKRYVFELVEREHRPVGVLEVARAIDSPYSTVSVSLLRMRDEGLLVGSVRHGFVPVVR